MEYDGFVVGWYVGLFPNVIDPIRNPNVVLFTQETVLRRNFLHVYPQGLRKYLCFCYRLRSRHCVRVRSKSLPSRGRWSQEAPNNLFNTCNLSRLGGHCLTKRLDAIFNSGRVIAKRAVPVSRFR